MSRWAKAPEPRDQMVLFAERLEDAIPPSHTVRQLDELLGRINWSSWEAQYHEEAGRRAIHPRVLAGVLLYGLLTRIRSSRGLEEAIQVRLDFRWLVSGRTIDHTTLSEFRRRFPQELKKLFVQICQVARELDLLNLRRLGFDGTRTRSNNRRSGTRTPAELQQERDQLATLIDAHLQQAEAADTADEELFESGTPQELPVALRDQQRRLEQIDALLSALQRAAAEGRSVPQRIPTTDLESRVMPNKDGGHAPNYTPLATVDIESGFIVGADVLNLVNEDGELIPAIEDVQQQFGLSSPPDVLTDGLNGTGANLAACEARGINIYSPCAVPDPAQNPALRVDPTQPIPAADWDRLPTHKVKSNGQSGTQLDKSAFVYDATHDCYWCPQGQPLPHTATTTEKSVSGQRIRARYQAAESACAGCPLRARCVQGAAISRQINREQYEAQRERHVQKMATTEAQEIYGQRRHPGERPFAVIKHQYGLRRFLLRGLDRVRTEWCWAATAFNLDRLMSKLRARAGPGTS